MMSNSQEKSAVSRLSSSVRVPEGHRVPDDVCDVVLSVLVLRSRSLDAVTEAVRKVDDQT